MHLPYLATDKNRWFALVFLALALAIVIIDNNVLSVAIPYILRDLNTSFDSIQWVISGYALIIATILITVGRIGDMIGRKKLFLLGTSLFALGSFIASISPNVITLFLGEAVIEAVGAAMMLTSSLALIVTEFQGKERAIAFGIWGAVAGASASLGPILGGFFTTYYSWRWSLRINVIIAVIAILGSIFVKEAKGEHIGKFDIKGTVFSGLGLFLLVFGFIEGRNFGWWTPVANLSFLGWQWPFTTISLIPFVFTFAAIFLALFLWTEYRLEKMQKEPLLRLSLFKNRGFTLGLFALGILVMGQFGSFFIFPLYYQNVLGLTAFQTGLIFLWTSITIAIFGPLSGVLAAKFGPKWIVVIGMLCSFSGIYWVSAVLSTTATGLTLGPPLVLLGMGIGLASSQVTNIILSHVPLQFSGEASAVNATFRQVGASIGTALLGTILAANLSTNIVINVQANTALPLSIRQQVAQRVEQVTAEGGDQALRAALPEVPICTTDGRSYCIGPEKVFRTVKRDVDQGLVDAARSAIRFGLIFIGLGIILSIFIPKTKLAQKK